MVTEDEWYDKRWYDSAVLVEDAVVEIKFWLRTHFDYGPGTYGAENGARDPEDVEPLIMPKPCLIRPSTVRCTSTGISAGR